MRQAGELRGSLPDTTVGYVRNWMRFREHICCWQDFGVYTGHLKRDEEVLPALLGVYMQHIKALPACFAALRVAVPVPKQAAYAPALQPPDGLLLHLPHQHLGLCIRHSCCV